jgi:hypothetical protein
MEEIKLKPIRIILTPQTTIKNMPIQPFATKGNKGVYQNLTRIN